ncbi:uncharacterized protein LOC129970106 [Argiope bruennichi]|uniref:Uncharacterized protein n=1 Tax=Argiope bruennichi TaxID=94029 RepID=A0A8T0E3E0_ARGBR|nr:uncharacterized protein LOC129970106 [Argiope bruennichi]KAF8764779.1 hypothetical protein HNY73_022825 [Argiope bruennichi]
MESTSELKCFQSSEEKLPSQVKTQPWIKAHSPKKCEELVSKMKSSFSTKSTQTEHNTGRDISKIGKWLLFNDIRQRNAAGLTQQDEAWQAIRQLVSNDVLFSAKCSTVWQGPYAGKSSGRKAVICCYTPDYSDKQDVKSAADSIRETVHYPMDMYYKTDVDTYAGKYSQFGDNAISMYKHTIDGVMYERDPTDKKKWNPLDL